MKMNIKYSKKIMWTLFSDKFVVVRSSTGGEEDTIYSYCQMRKLQARKSAYNYKASQWSNEDHLGGFEELTKKKKKSAT